MTRFQLDTGIASDYINRRHGVFERVRSEVAKGNRIGIGVPVLAELVAGIEHSKSRDRNMQRLRSVLASLKIWPFDAPAAFERWRGDCRRQRRGGRGFSLAVIPCSGRQALVSTPNSHALPSYANR
ncbi:MAG: type II toxin-antitoxin system VapC family toxin [Planctomycetes bacterium]|nr:type II toxin-antitoxin system VapC family toxin [Planctomycetota bacterium]